MSITKKRYVSLSMATAVIALAISCVSVASDAGHSADYRTFNSDGSIAYGQIKDSYTSDLVMYLAGNQFMVMETLIKDFQTKTQTLRTYM